MRIDKIQTATHISAKKAIKEGDINLAQQYSYMFLLGLLNSTLINWYFKFFLSEGLHFYPNDAKNLPIIKINPQDKQQAKQIEGIIKYTELILGLIEKREQAVANEDSFQISQTKQRILYTEQQLDLAVLDLYGITNVADRELILRS